MLAFLVSLVALASAAPKVSEIPPEAGALDIYLNSTSVNNMFQLMVPILSYYMLQNLDIPVNVKSSNPVFSIGLDSFHLDSVQFNGDKLFEVNSDRESEIHMKFLDVDIDASINGSI